MMTSSPADGRNGQTAETRSFASPQAADAAEFMSRPSETCPDASLRLFPASDATCHRTAAAMSALMLSHGLSALAQGVPDPTLIETNAPSALPPVIVTGQSLAVPELSSPRLTGPLRDIPQSITVVPQEIIQQQGATSLRDVLRNVPGITMQAGEGGGGLPGDNLSIRGFNSRSDIFVDGVRDFGATARDPYSVEQVEVTKGPTSATTGRGSVGGAVNLVTKRPLLTPQYDATMGFGTADYKRLTLDVNQPLAPAGLETSAVRLNALWHEADVPGRDVLEDNRWGVNPSLAFGLGTPTRLTLDYQHLEQDNVAGYGIPWVPAGNTNAVLSQYINQAPPVDFANFYGLKGYDFEDVRNDLVTATVERDFNDSVRLRNLSRYADVYRRHAITAPRFADIDPGPATVTDTLVNRQLQQRQLEHDILANVTDANFEFETGPFTHALVAGFEISYEQQDNRNSAQTTNQPLTDIFHPTPADQPFGPMPGITGVPNEATALTAAPYVFDTLKFAERWQVTGGLRWDHVDSDYESGTNQLDRVDDMVSWRAGLVFNPAPNGSIYFGYGTAFTPAIAAGSVGLGLTANDVNLDPEETQSFELGSKWNFLEERLSLTAALFRTEKTNARTTGASPGDPPIVLDGEQVVQGVEFSVAGRITPEWQVLGGYAYMHSEITDSNVPSEVGAEFANTPDHSFSLWTTYDLPLNLQAGFGTQYVGDRYNSQSGSPTVRVAEGYWLFDAMLAWQLSELVTLRVNVLNLADEEYIGSVGGGHFIPGPGRSAMVTAMFTF